MSMQLNCIQSSSIVRHCRQRPRSVIASKWKPTWPKCLACAKSEIRAVIEELAPTTKQLVNSWISTAVLKVSWRVSVPGERACRAGACQTRMPFPLWMLSESPPHVQSPGATLQPLKFLLGQSRWTTVPQWHSSSWSKMEHPCCRSLWTRSAEAKAGPGRQH